MSINTLLNAIQNSGVAHLISKSNHLVAAGLQVVHVLGFILLLSALLMISLRLLGLVLQQQPLAEVTRDANRMVWIGLGIAVVSGTLLFVATPKLYFYNWAFELKMLLLVIAVTIQTTLFRKVAASSEPSVLLARTSVALSLVFWFGISLAGRVIGFI
jgi:hypothetical protein